jgi:hypothetical protein
MWAYGFETSSKTGAIDHRRGGVIRAVSGLPAAAKATGSSGARSTSSRSWPEK